jgi:Na+-driven multidrug efflux pump
MKALALPGRGRFDREIAVLAVPALGALLADPLLSLVDTAFVGHLGAAALGALGVAVAAFEVVFFAFTFLEYGTTARVARAVGADDREGASRAAITALVLAAACGMVVALLLGWGAEAVVRAMGASAEVRTGAAWGTVAAQWLGAGLFVYLLTVRHRVRLGIHLALPDRAETAAFLRAAAHLAVRSGSLLAVFTLATAVAAQVSDAAVAAHQVVFQVWLFLALGLDALAVAGQAMVGARLGAGNGGDARAVADRLLVLGLGLGLVLAALVAAVAPTLPWWFTADPRVVSRVRSVYWLLVAAQPVGAVVFVWDGVFLGAGDFAYLAAATGGCSAAAAGLLLAVLPKGWGLPGVWWAILALIVLRGLTLAVRRVASAGPLGG